MISEKKKKKEERIVNRFNLTLYIVKQTIRHPWKRVIKREKRKEKKRDLDTLNVNG